MEIKPTNLRAGILDKVGVIASVSCMMHCLLLPALLPLLSLSGLAFVAEPEFETGLVAFAVVVASYSILFSYFKRHQQLMPLYFFLSGVVFLVIARVFVSESIERFILPVGTAFFAVAHFINLRLCKSCAICSDKE